jgi:hypothetical protein
VVHGFFVGFVWIFNNFFGWFCGKNSSKKFDLFFVVFIYVFDDVFGKFCLKQVYQFDDFLGGF